MSSLHLSDRMQRCSRCNLSGGRVKRVVSGICVPSRQLSATGKATRMNSSVCEVLGPATKSKEKSLLVEAVVLEEVETAVAAEAACICVSMYRELG